jgi:hypothetical protein
LLSCHNSKYLLPSVKTHFVKLSLSWTNSYIAPSRQLLSE